MLAQTLAQLLGLCLRNLARHEEILARASRDAKPDRRGLARLEKILAQPCAHAPGICLGSIFLIEFVLTKIL